MSAQLQDISTIIQAEQKINSAPAGTLPGIDEKKDLSGIVERLLWKQQHQSRDVSDFYDEIQTSRKEADESSSSKVSKTHTLKLNRVNDSDIAVYQSFHTENDNNSNMQDEVKKFNLIYHIDK